MLKIFAIAVTLLTLSSGLAFADDGDKKVATFGKWDVFYGKDMMTDEPSCLARYKGKENVQLSVKSFAIGSLVYPEGYEYRFDDEPVSGMQINPDGGKRSGSILVSESSFVQKAVSSKRFRAQIVGGKFYQYDISLNGASDAYAKMKSLGCTK